MKKTIYLECNAGISGDMTVGALLDLGVEQEVLKEALSSLPISGYEIIISKVKKSGIECCDFNVVLDKEHENHDHDMEYLHGDYHEHHHKNEHEHHHGHEHHHENGPEHQCENHHHHEHHHEHRGMREICEIIDGSNITEKAKNIAKDIFTVLAKSEAKAHAVPIEQVHFHEVGAVDSIVDIVAVAVCLDNLQVDKVIVKELCEGTGTVRCAHGILPVPVPAVANIMEKYGIPVRIMEAKGEFVTPTGAAIVAAISNCNKLPDRFIVKRIGMGAGKRNYERASILRAMWIEEIGDEEVFSNSLNESECTIYKLETNIDDCTGEALGFVMERLLEAGARDVHYTPVYMKKNRPGWQLNVICMKKEVDILEKIIFKHTTTIGIRKIKMERDILSRKMITVETPYGQAEVKLCESNGIKKYYPEHESIVQLCNNTDKSYQEIYNCIIENALLIK